MKTKIEIKKMITLKNKMFKSKSNFYNREHQNNIKSQIEILNWVLDIK